MGNATRTPADPTRGTRNTVHDGATEGRRSPAENTCHPENAHPRPRGRPTAREELAALFDAPSAPAFADSPRLAELLARYHLELIAPRATARLAAIFEADPPDALARLERACDHLGVTGDQAAELVNRAHAHDLPPASATTAKPRGEGGTPPACAANAAQDGNARNARASDA